MRALCFFLVMLAACSTDTFDSPDGGSGNDGGGGGDGSATDAACSSFCAGKQATFCSDFDEGTFGADWDSAPSSATPLITIAPTTDFSRSCPTAMRVGIEPFVAFNPLSMSFSYLEKNFGGGTTVSIDLDAYLPDIVTADASANLDGLIFFALRSAADTSYYTSLEHSGDGIWYIRIHATDNVLSSAALPGIIVGKWNHLKLAVTLAGGTGGFASLTYDDGSASPPTATTDKVTTLPPGNTNTATVFDLGAARLAPTTQHYDVFFDNVVANVN